MLKQVRIKNFLSFKDTVVDLRNLNVCVGINGSGKTNFLKVFELLDHAINFDGLIDYLIREGGFEHFSFGGEHDDIHIQLVFDFQSGESTYHLQLIESANGTFSIKEEVSDHLNRIILTNNGNSLQVLNETTQLLEEVSPYQKGESGLRLLFKPEAHTTLLQIQASLRTWIVLPFLDTSSKSGVRRNGGSRNIPNSLEADGKNLSSFLEELKETHPKQFQRIETLLKEINPAYLGLEFAEINGKSRIFLREAGLKNQIGLDKISDGTLRLMLLGIHLLTLQPNGLIYIDEPEIGFHPDMISLLADLIKEASESATILVNTHSTRLLNQLNLADILVFSKNETNESSIKRLNEQDFENWYETFSPGEMWMAGDFGGVRYGG